MNKLFQLISITTIIAANLILAVGFYWYLYPYKTVEFPNQPFPVIEKEVIGGGRLTYIVDYCKYSSVNPIITRYFKDGLIYVVADIVSANNKLGCHTNKIQIYVPKGLPAGEYYMELVYFYKVNPIRTMVVSAHTESFVVKEAL